jgi:hypothetical protein
VVLDHVADDAVGVEVAAVVEVWRGRGERERREERRKG